MTKQIEIGNIIFAAGRYTKVTEVLNADNYGVVSAVIGHRWIKSKNAWTAKVGTCFTKTMPVVLTDEEIKQQGLG